MARTRQALLLFLALALLHFLPVLFSGTRITGNFGDLFLHYYPLRQYTAEQVIAGRVPLWNPHIFCGQPLLANPQSAVFYPMTAFFYFLPVNRAFNYILVLHFFLAACFTWLLLKRYRCSDTGALLGGISFAFSSFLVYRVTAGHVSAICGYAWLPLIALFLDAVADRRGSSYLAQGGAALALSFQFLSGHPFPTYITAVFVAVHFIGSGARYWRVLLRTGAMTLALCAVQFIPSLELSRITETGSWPELVRSYSLAPLHLITVLLPDYFGNVVNGTFAERASSSFFFEKNGLFFGTLPALLALPGCVLLVRRRKYFYVALFAVGLMLAFGSHTPFYRVVAGAVPVFEFLRAPARFYFLCLLSLTVMAAVAWDRWVKGRSAVLKALLIGLAAAQLFAWNHRFIYPADMSSYQRQSEISGTIDPSYRVLTDPVRLSANKTMLYHMDNVNGYEAVLLRPFTRYVGLQERRVFNPSGLARADLSSPLARGLSIGYQVTPQELRAPGLKKISAGEVNVYAVDGALPLAFIPKRVNAIPGADEEQDYLRHTTLTPADEIVLRRTPDGFGESAAEGRILSLREDAGTMQAQVELAKGGPVTFSGVTVDGWKVAAAGLKPPVLAGNGLLRTVFLPAGRYINEDRVILYYDPASWRIGLGITVAGFLALLLVLIRKGKKVV